MPRGHIAPRTDAAREAVAYIRVSRKLQAEGHSPGVQRERLKQLAVQEGYVLAPDMIYEDHERGGNVSRAGYQHVIERVREGRASAVLVWMFDRFGRDGAEWLTRAREFDRLGVPIISAQEGKDGGGLLRFVRAGMAEEESVKIAKRVKPTREAAARRGVHCGSTPYGYKRIYAAWDGNGRRPTGQLVIDEATAWVIAEIYERYAAGGWSVRKLAEWLNADPRVGPSPAGGLWNAAGLRWMLINESYKGAVAYNKRHTGAYVTSTPDEFFVVEEQHPAIVTVETWNEVQRRLVAARRSPTSNLVTTGGRTVQLASGLMRCAGCGGPMIAVIGCRQYYCLERKQGRGCRERACTLAVVHEAILDEIARLRPGRPWNAKAEKILVNGNATDVDRAARLTKQLDAENERLKRHVRRMSDAVEDPSDEEIGAFRAVSQEIRERIASIRAELVEAQAHAVSLVAVKAKHETVTKLGFAEEIAYARAHGLTHRLRPLVFELVASATIIDRRPPNRATWARIEVQWTDDYALLIQTDLLRLADAAPVPDPLPKIKKTRRKPL